MVVSVAHLERFLQLLSCSCEVIVVHIIASFIICNSNMPPFRKHIDFNILSSVNEAKVAMTKVEVVQSELDSNDT